MKTAVIYARYSSERQTDQSIDGQLRICNEFAIKNDIKIVDTYIDRAMTGTNDNRAAFQKMLSDSDKSQPWDIVLVYAIDRFGRNSIEIAINKQRLQKNGKILISATQRTSTNLDGTKNLDGILLENVLVGIAEYYSAELSLKVCRGLNESREKGLFTGGPIAYGYKVINKKVYIDEETSEIVKYIYREYSIGKIVKEIIAELTAKGIFYNGKPFVQNTVYKILRLEKYTGVYRFKGEIYDNIYPQIIPKNLFDEIQVKLAKNKLGSRSREVVFLLKGKLFCGLCGRKINGESGTSHTGSTNYYYKCSGRKQNSGCQKSVHKQEQLEKIVIQTTMSFLNSPEQLHLIADAIIQVHEKQLKDQSALKYLEKERDTTQNALNNMMKAIEQGILTPTTKSRVNELEELLEQLKIKISAEECNMKNRLSREQIINYLKNAATLCPKTLIETFIRKIILYDEKIEIYYNYTNNPNPDNPSNRDSWDFFLPVKSPLSPYCPPIST